MEQERIWVSSTSALYRNTYSGTVFCFEDTVVLLRIDTPFLLGRPVILLCRHSSFALNRHSAILAVAFQATVVKTLHRS
jgi:hypothetical protein